jgi:oligoendopeptidase F
MSTAAAAPPFPDTPDQATIARRRFVPRELDAADWDAVQPLCDALLSRDLDTAEALRAWLVDYSELTAVLYEHGARVRIAQASHTQDDRVKQRFMHWIEQIAPKLAPIEDQLHRKLLDSPALPELTADPAMELMVKHWRTETELFREQNIPLRTQVQKKVADYDQLVGAMKVEFRGRTYTMQQLGRFLDDPDRDTREEAWTLSAERRIQDREAMDGLFDELVQLRKQIAHNADLPDYRAYAWQDMHRFDYTPEDCEQFWDAIESCVLPICTCLAEHRRDTLGLEKLRPWDGSVDPQGRPPLRPFDGEDVDRLVGGTKDILARLDPGLADEFAVLQPGLHLDLASRPNKRGGGFQSSLSETGQPFIFMNAAGLQRDVRTMLHEGGHAFHFLWAHAMQPLVFTRHAPMEFCEVASMSLELLTLPHYDVFYEGDEAGGDRARREQLEGVIQFFPWMATIDSFQHWLHTNPDHTPDERTAEWLKIQDRYSTGVTAWTGYEDTKASQWQRQLHLFHHPFYYVEYGIAQLGALQLWVNYQQDAADALRRYREALSLGGSRSLPELFDAAGLTFDFSEQTIRPLMEHVEAELEKLPA